MAKSKKKKTKIIQINVCKAENGYSVEICANTYEANKTLVFTTYEDAIDCLTKNKF